MKRFKSLLTIAVLFVVMLAMAATYFLFKTLAFIVGSLLEALFSDKGVQKLMDNVFYGSVFIIILHASEISILSLSGVDLAVFIGLTLLLKPLEKLIIKSQTKS